MNATLNRPNVIARGVLLLVGVACVVVIAVVIGGGSSYVLNVGLANASGLRPGSQVLLGGVPVGTVGDITFDSRINGVVAQLDLNRSDVHIGAGVKAAIVAANLLGEEYVSLQPGNASKPLPSGTTLPESATTVPTDLDQIVDVLDGPTRARLAILLDEAGIAVAGRRADVNALMAQFPASLQAATRLVDGMITDNHTLGDAVASSDSFITQMDAQGVGLKKLIGAAARATTTLAVRADDLRQSLAQAPSFERVSEKWFTKGGETLTNFAKPAGELADALPYLDQLLTQVQPFTQDAVPTLNRAAAVAPTLTQLADQATPIVSDAVPTLSSLSHLASLSQPLSSWLGLSAQDLVAIAPGWSHAVQYRDGLSHLFGGEIYLDPQIVLGVADKGATAAERRQNLVDIISPAIVRTLGLVGAQNAARRALTGVGSVVKKVTSVLAPRPAPARPAPATPAGALGSGTGTATGTKPVTSPVISGLGGVLGRLLGGLTGHGSSGDGGSGAGAQTGASGSTGVAGSSGAGLRGLLSYLMGK